MTDDKLRRLRDRVIAMPVTTGATSLDSMPLVARGALIAEIDLLIAEPPAPSPAPVADRFQALREILERNRRWSAKTVGWKQSCVDAIEELARLVMEER